MFWAPSSTDIIRITLVIIRLFTLHRKKMLLIQRLGLGFGLCQSRVPGLGCLKLKVSKPQI